MAKGDPIAFAESAAFARQEHNVPHPREGLTFRDLSPQRQGEVHQAMSDLHAEMRPKMEEHLSSRISDIRSNPAKLTPAKRTELSSLESAADELSSLPSDPMEAAVQRVTRTADMPVQAVREHRKRTGEMRGVVAGEFYGTRHDIGNELAESYFPGSSNEDKRLRSVLATPEWSARTSPQAEVEGASGMLALLKHGEHIGVEISPEVANLLNTQPVKDDPSTSLGYKGRHGGATDIEPGTVNFARLAERHPQAAAIMIQHHARESGLVSPVDEKTYTDPNRLAVMQGRQEILQAGAKIHLPDELEGAAAATVQGMGQVGFSKAGRSIRRFHTDPSEFEGGDQHKIGSYTWNNLNHDQLMAAGTHHMLGVVAHGKDWLQENPEATEILRAARAHPAWSDPTTTVDVHSGRVVTGLPTEALSVMGKEGSNPDKLLAGRGMPRQRRAEPLGRPKDAGYLWGEEAHRQAGYNRAKRIPGVGLVRTPPHVEQSMSWFGVQAEQNAHDIETGKRTMAPRSMQDPESLNSLRSPEIYG